MYVEKERFEPPEYGLKPGEEIVWHQRAGTPFLFIFCGVCFPLLSVFVIIFTGSIYGASIVFGLVFFVLIGILYTVYSFIKIRRTKYYLTTSRLLEVRSGEIQEEISLELFKGKPHTEFLQIKEDHQDAGIQYNIRVFDIESNKMIELKVVDEDVLDLMKKIGTQ